jgi:hypothetical protein
MNKVHHFHAPNPLTRHLRDWKTIEEVAEELRYDPLEGLDIAALSTMERLELLLASKCPLLPTSLSLSVAIAMISMHRHSLRARNPTIATNRRILSETMTEAQSGTDFYKRPPAPGACLQIVKGVQGTAKSVTVQHTLDRLIGPQVIHHGEEPAALFCAATQLSWLFVGMSHDGSRSGLLGNILLAIDRVMGSTHAQDLPKLHRTVERLAGAVIALLHSYWLGILVIDEIQLLNLVDSPHAELMQLFLLNLINSGIPVVLIGNPLGFAWLPLFSQNLARSVERPSIFFHPCGAVGGPEEDEWDIVYLGVAAFYLLDEPPRDGLECRDQLKRLSGGIPRQALALWCTAQVNVIQEGRRFLTAADLRDVYLSDAFSDLRGLCDGFANRDPTLLMSWRDTDVPVDYYARAWGRPLGGGGRDIGNGGSGSDIPVPPRPPTASNAPVVSGAADASNTSEKARTNRPRSAESKFKAAQTRERNKLARRTILGSSLPTEDMRMDGIKQHTLASFNELMIQIEEEKKR